MKNILVIGAGGIGSYFARELNTLVMHNVNGIEGINVTIQDGDEVEEKNLRYQNFEINDLGKNKANAICDRYLFSPKTTFIENQESLQGYDIIILAVDNGKVRNLVYEYCSNNNVYFIDLRSEGRSISFFTKHEKNTLEYLKSTINVEAPSTSCQLRFELDNGIIQQGNKIIGTIGTQLLLNYLRGDNNIPSYMVRI